MDTDSGSTQSADAGEERRAAPASGDNISEPARASAPPLMTLAQHGGRSADLPGVGRLRFEAEGSLAERRAAMRRIAASWNLLRFQPLELVEMLAAYSDESHPGRIEPTSVEAVLHTLRGPAAGAILAVVASAFRALVGRLIRGNGEHEDFRASAPPGYVRDALALLDAVHPDDAERAGQAQTVGAYLWATCREEEFRRFIAADLRRGLAERIVDPPARVVGGEPPAAFRAAVSDLLARVGSIDRSLTDREVVEQLWGAILAPNEGGER